MNEIPIFTVDRGELRPDTMPRRTARLNAAARKARAEAIICTSTLCILVASFGTATYFAGGGR